MNSSPIIFLFSSGSTGKSKASVHDITGILEKFKVPSYTISIWFNRKSNGGFDGIFGMGKKTPTRNDINVTVTNQNNEIVMRKPEGKNVKIEFDKFFKTYYITYYDDRGSYVYLNLSYLTGEMVNDEHVWRMHDQNKNYFIVADQIKTKNRLVITVETKLGGEMKAHYWISNTQLE